MTTPHTPGLLAADANHNLVTGTPDNLYTIADCETNVSIGLTDEAIVANARRLAACWNAFDGAEIGLIECVPALGTATLPYRILQARGEALAFAVGSFLDPEGRPPEDTGEWRGLLVALAAYRSARTEP
jgi:hypothetical protein